MSKQIENFVVAAVETAVVDNGVHYVRSDQKFAPVVSALVDTIAAQGDKVADSIRNAAATLGLSESEVENFLIQVGLADAPEPEPTPEPEPVTLESLAAAQAKSDALLQEILQVAKQDAPRQFAHIG